MTSDRTPPARRRRQLLVAPTLFAVAVALTGLSATDARAQLATGPPVIITVNNVRSSVLPPPSAGAPADLLVAQEPFAVDVSFTAGGIPKPISEFKAVTLEVSAAGGPGFTATSVTRVVVPKGAVGGTFAQLTLDAAANGVVLSVTATAPAKDVLSVVPGSSSQLDVAKDYVSFAFQGVGGATVSREGPAVPCTATAARTTCVDLVLPPSANNGTQALFSTGVCSASVGCEPGRDVLQVLAVFGLTKQAPATLIVKCDKSLCGGGAIAGNVLKVSTAPSGPLIAAPACSSKGVIDEGVESCVDYVQSRRDGSGDTYLYWLVTRDARMSI